mmetsp:Transcript_59783/g.160206  ORF Transcript_59783/g.160206 Transcript_59783/m.160206 type:complete len:234 (-) Transcript_59783:1753-2454(-)
MTKPVIGAMQCSSSNSTSRSVPSRRAGGRRRLQKRLWRAVCAELSELRNWCARPFSPSRWIGLAPCSASAAASAQWSAGHGMATTGFHAALASCGTAAACASSSSPASCFSGCGTSPPSHSLLFLPVFSGVSSPVLPLFGCPSGVAATAASLERATVAEASGAPAFRLNTAILWSMPPRQSRRRPHFRYSCSRKRRTSSFVQPASNFMKQSRQMRSASLRLPAHLLVVVWKQT